jgi:hypothetical protein
MALDTFGGIRSISVPTWLKLLIFLIVLAALGADLAIAVVSLTNPLHKDWFTVSVQLVGSLLPLLLAILLLAFSSRGPEAIRRKTSYLLLHLVPDTIACSLTWSPEFDIIEKKQWGKPRPKTTRIEIGHRPGDFCCVYRISFPELHSVPTINRVVLLVIELKVRQANMHLCVPRNAFEDFCSQSGMAGFAAFTKAFPLTLGGAEKAGCNVNPAIYQFAYSKGAFQTGVVVYRNLSENFLTDSSEQLFWAQDLVIMLKGFVEEGLAAWQPVPWFPEVTRPE